MFGMRVLHHIPEAIPITCHQVLVALIRNEGLSPRFPNTAKLIRYSFMGNSYAASVSANIQNLPLTLHPLPKFPCFHR